MQDINYKLGAFLQEIRTKQGLSQEDATELADFSKNKIGRIERAEGRIKFDDFFNLFKIYGFDFYDFLDYLNK